MAGTHARTNLALQPVGGTHARLLASPLGTRIDSYLVPGLELPVLNIPTPAAVLEARKHCAALFHLDWRIQD